jgi:RNA polymerase sigma factor (sigma-70 family)
VDAEREGKALLCRLERLRPGERDVMELVALAGLAPAEAADVLGISAGAARVRLHRAKAALRQKRKTP